MVKVHKYKCKICANYTLTGEDSLRWGRNRDEVETESTKNVKKLNFPGGQRGGGERLR